MCSTNLYHLLNHSSNEEVKEKLHSIWYWVVLRPQIWKAAYQIHCNHLPKTKPSCFYVRFNTSQMGRDNDLEVTNMRKKKTWTSSTHGINHVEIIFFSSCFHSIPWLYMKYLMKCLWSGSEWYMEELISKGTQWFEVMKCRK